MAVKNQHGAAVLMVSLHFLLIPQGTFEGSKGQAKYFSIK